MLKVFLSCGVANEEADPGLGGKYDFFFFLTFCRLKDICCWKMSKFFNSKKKNKQKCDRLIV